jgi:hypothetical protein
MGYGARLHDWITDELESMKTLSLSRCLRACPSLLNVAQPIVADQRRTRPSSRRASRHSLDTFSDPRHTRGQL